MCTRLITNNGPPAVSKRGLSAISYYPIPYIEFLPAHILVSKHIPTGSVLERGEAPLLPILPLPLIREGGQGDRLPYSIIPPGYCGGRPQRRSRSRGGWQFFWSVPL